MRNFLKNVDLNEMKDQITEVKDQLADLHFRKPWSRGSDSSPVLFLAIGAALAALGMALYRNREEVASFCSNCGTDLKSKWESSGMKEKAEKFMNKGKEAVNGTQEGMEASSSGGQNRY
jgi:hypothetical protein